MVLKARIRCRNIVPPRRSKTITSYIRVSDRRRGGGRLRSRRKVRQPRRVGFPGSLEAMLL